MSYQSITFLIFSAIVILLYYIVPKKLQRYILLMANVFFYVCSDIKYIPFLTTTLITTYIVGRFIGRVYEKEEMLVKECESPSERKAVKAKHKAKAKKMLMVALILSIGLLAVCKYSLFALENLGGILPKETLSAADELQIIVPLGISFYTFMAVSYVLDVYWKRYKAEKSFISYAVFLTYFPHIVQGPIGRYNRFKAQLPVGGIAFDSKAVAQGAQLVIWGLFKKLVIADRLNIFVSEIYGNYQDYKGLVLVIATVLYSIQIYADFSGCIDIVSGVSEAMGIKLQKNFNHPYFSKTIPEFWRRWHMSLGEWFKDYVYYPVSVSRLVKSVKKHCKIKRVSELFASCLPIFVVWLITGIWHGASWNYVVWGLYYAVIMITSTVFEPAMQKLKEKFGIDDSRFSWKLFQMSRTFAICCIGRVFFRASDMDAAISIFENMLSGLYPKLVFGEKLYTYGLDKDNFMFAMFSIFILWAVDMLQERMNIRQEIAKQGIVFRWTIIFLGIFAVLIFGVYGPGYDASTFIYEQF
ncbi:MAG: MBOAT family protein [Agathobacter sp.]|nr:MBOAT family protein [Agathobacter sp.]